MAFFGFGKKKEYKRGMSDAAEAAGKKFEEVNAGLGNVKDNLHTGVNQMNENMRSVLDVLESDEREKLFGISESLTIKNDLDENQKMLLMSVIYSIADREQEVNENQQHYLRAMYHYLEMNGDVQLIDVANIYNIDTRDESKILYDVVNEFLYLGHENWDYLDSSDYDYVFDNFNLSKRDKQEVIDSIKNKVAIMGIEALVLPYETAPETSTETEEADTVAEFRSASEYFETQTQGYLESMLPNHNWHVFTRDADAFEDRLNNFYSLNFEGDYGPLYYPDLNGDLPMAKEDVLAFVSFGDEQIEPFIIFGENGVVLDDEYNRVILYQEIDSIYNFSVYKSNGSRLFMEHRIPLLADFMEFTNPNFSQQQTDRKTKQDNKWNPDNAELRDIFARHDDVSFSLEILDDITAENANNARRSFKRLPENYDEKRLLLVANGNIGQMKKGLMITEGLFYYSTENGGGSTSLYDLRDINFVSVDTGALGSLEIDGFPISSAGLLSKKDKLAGKELLNDLIAYAKDDK